MPLTLTPKLFGASLEVTYPRLRPFNPIELDEFCTRATASLAFPHSSDRFRLRPGDALYGYELVGNFLGENVQLRRTAERAVLTLRNGRTSQDQQFILNKASAFLQGFGTDAQAISLTAFCHGLSSEEGAVEAYLRRFVINGRIKFPGATGRVEVEGWPELVKVNLEASFLVQGGVFVSWETPLVVPSPERPSNDLLERSSHALRSAAAVFGLEFGAIAP